MSRVLIVGSGQLGTRHLQAVASLPGIDEIVVVDPSPASLDLGRERLAQIDDAAPGIEYRWETAIPNDGGGELAIVATQSKGRADIVAAAADAGWRDFLLEKVVTRSLADYDRLITLAESGGHRMWVNCKTRTYGIHKEIKAALGADEPVVLTDIGGNFGLGNIGVHAADLFAFYDGSDHIGRAAAVLDDVLHPSKRGGDVRELSGALYGSTPKGGRLVIDLGNGHFSPDTVTIAAPRARYVIDHMLMKGWRSTVEGEWRWEELTMTENWSVSFMTKAFAADILANRACELPTLAECRVAHEFILESLLPKFRELLGDSELAECPIT